MNIESLMEIEDDDLSMPQYLQFQVRSIKIMMRNNLFV